MTRLDRTNAPHYLYRCYDADGVLLYVGCTSEPKRRISSHRRGDKAASRWLSVCADRYEVDADEHPGRIAGRAAEAAAIEAERPVFNIQHNLRNGHWAHSGAQYLVDHGHLPLAVETMCSCWRETRDAGMCDPWCAPHVAEGVRPILPAGEAAA